MSQTTPPSLTAPGTAPDRSDRATFSARATAFATWMATAVTEFAALATNVYNNAVDAYNNTVAAAVSAVQAAASATAAAAAAACSIWITGTTYAIGDVRFSPSNFQSYRRKTAGAGSTDPASDTTNWARVQTGLGLGGSTITGSVTLTNASNGAQYVTPTGPGLYATLPDATTLSTGDGLFSFYNAGDYDYGVKNSAGTILGWVKPRSGCSISLADNSTAAGSWVPDGVSKLGITMQYNAITLANMGSSASRVAINSNRDLILFGGTSVYGMVFDKSTGTLGSATLIRSGISSGAWVACLQTTNQVLVCSNDSTTGFNAVILSISSTTITVNTAATATLAGNWASFGQVVMVGTSAVVSYGRATTVSAIRAMTISGTTVTIGAESALAPAVTTSAYLFVSGSVVRTVTIDATTLYAKPYTVSGSSLSAGTQATTGTSSVTPPRVTQNGNGNLVATYLNTNFTAAVIKLTGTVEAITTVSLGGSAPTSASVADTIDISAGKTLFVWHAGSTAWYINILTDTAGTASAGTAVTVTSLTSPTLAALTSGSNVVRIGSSEASRITHTKVDCSGASPSILSSQSIGSASGVLPTMPPTDLLGTRDRRVLVAGSSAYVIASPVNQASIQMNDIGVQLERVLPIPVTNAAGVAGASSAETYIAATYNNGTVGMSISKVEAAA